VLTPCCLLLSLPVIETVEPVEAEAVIVESVVSSGQSKEQVSFQIDFLAIY